jgi:hypothetical protein
MVSSPWQTDIVSAGKQHFITQQLPPAVTAPVSITERYQYVPKDILDRAPMCIAGEHYNCTRIYGDRTVSLELKHRPEPYQFKFDCVLPENTSQLEIFEREWMLQLP